MNKVLIAIVVFLLLSFKEKLKVMYCKIIVYKCYSTSVDTIYIKAHGGICIATFEGDSIPKLVDKRNYIYADSVCDYKVVKISKKPFNH